jgi:hypothetical protein
MGAHEPRQLLRTTNTMATFTTTATVTQLGLLKTITGTPLPTQDDPNPTPIVETQGAVTLSFENGVTFTVTVDQADLASYVPGMAKSISIADVA